MLKQPTLFKTKKTLALIIFLEAALNLGCKAHFRKSELQDIRVSPDFPASAQTIWHAKDGKVHLGNCRDCKDSTDAAEPIDRSEYEVKVRTATVDMRGAEKKDFGQNLKEVQEKLKSMQEKLKTSGPNGLNAEEKVAFESQIAVLEKVLGLTEEEKKLIKPIFDALNTTEVTTYHQGQRRFALARAPFGPLVSAKSPAAVEVKVGWRPFPEQKGTPPSARMGHTAVMIDRKMIVWGGQGIESQAPREIYDKKNDGAIFDVDSSTWTPLPETYAESRVFHSAVTIGRKMIIWGGRDVEPKKDGWIFDLDSKKWSRIKDAPFASYEHTAVVHNGKMFVCGGHREDKKFSPEVAVYDEINDEWTLLANASSPLPDETSSTPLKYSHVALRIENEVTRESEMIVWGGQIKGQGWSFSGKASHFNFRSEKWTAFPKSNSPLARTNPTAVAIGPKIIVWGGRSNQYHADGVVFDTSANSWSYLASGPDASKVPAARTAHSAVVVDNKMIVWGGVDSSTIGLSDGWIYEFAKEK